MARANCKILDTGDFFPRLQFNSADGSIISLPEDLGDRWNVLIFYRGHWWIFCRQQLLDFQRNIEEFNKMNIRIIAASADSLEQVMETITKYKLTFKAGYGLIPKDISALTGAFYNEEENYIQATGFIIGPDKRIENAVYSSRSVGRLTAKDCLNFIKEW